MNTKQKDWFVSIPRVDLDRDATSNRSSVSSSRSSSRLSRLRCKLVIGDWCTHEECRTSKSVKDQRTSILDNQRNTNNVTLSASHQPSNDDSNRRSNRRTSVIDSNSTDSTLLDQNASRLAATSSTFVCTYVSDDVDDHVIQQNQSLSNHRGDGPDWDKPDPPSSVQSLGRKRVNKLLSASSSVNYSSRDPTDLETNRTKTSSWITKHIYGLDRSNNANPHNRYITSDTEDVDTQTHYKTRRSRGRSAVSSSRSAHPSISPTLTTERSGAGFLVYVTQLFTLLSTLMYKTSEVVASTIKNTLAYLFVSDCGSLVGEKLVVHPRLTQFDSQTRQSSVFHGRSHFPIQPTRHQSHWLRKYWFPLLICLSLLPFILIFLFAPFADAQNSSLWSTFVPDVACLARESVPTVGENATYIERAKWRIQCLYDLYGNSSGGDNNDGDDQTPNSTGQGHWWSRWLYSESSSTAPPAVHIDVDRLPEQLNSFLQSISSRLDQLTKSLQDTRKHIDLVEVQSGKKMKTMADQLSTLQTQFAKHSNSLDQFNVQLHSLNLLLSQSGSKDGGELPTAEFDRLFVAVLHAANETIRSEINLLRADMDKGDQIKADYWNASVGRLNLLQTHLRDQLLDRLSQVETKLINVEVELAKNRNSVDRDKLTGDLRTLQSVIDKLSMRLTEQQRLSAEASGLHVRLQDAVKKCTDDHTQQLDKCRLAAAEQTESRFLLLSEKLQSSITELVKEQFLRDLEGETITNFVKLKLDKSIRQAINEALAGYNYNYSSTTGGSLLPTDRGIIQQLIDESLQKFAADRTGMADYALESAGGTIVGTRCTRTYTDGAALFSVFGIPLARLSNSPRTIIQPGNNPGDCWPFHGSSGQAVIRLSSPIHITAVSLEHLPRSLTPNNRVDSAPKDFLIKGLASEHDQEGIVLGRFTYDVNFTAIQTYPIKDQTQLWQLIEFAVLNNHGHPSYTCVYRLRVHGRLASP